MQRVNELLSQLKLLKIDLYRKDFLLTWDRTRAELEAVLAVAEMLKLLRDAGVSPRLFDTGLAVSIFRDKSTRTRFSFSSATNLLGLQVQELDEETSQVAHGETVRETANMISFLADVIGIRDDMYLGAGHTYMKEFAQSLELGWREGALPRRTTVVNLQCDVDHPTQAMADLLHLKQTYGGLEALRGKRIAMSWAYSPSYGKPLSVPQGVIGLLTRFGCKVTLAHPKGYGLLPEVMERAAAQAHESGGSFDLADGMDAAFREADAVYPKSWAPWAVMRRRTELRDAGAVDGLRELEREGLAENARHADWECDARRMALTAGGSALYMHCLPADITGVSCPRGEVSSEVFAAAAGGTWRQASWKPFVIAAVILLARAPDPVRSLQGLWQRREPRV